MRVGLSSDGTVLTQNSILSARVTVKMALGERESAQSASAIALQDTDVFAGDRSRYHLSVVTSAGLGTARTRKKAIF